MLEYSVAVRAPVGMGVRHWDVIAMFKFLPDAHCFVSMKYDQGSTAEYLITRHVPQKINHFGGGEEKEEDKLCQ